MVFATNKRLLFISKSWMILNVEDAPYTNITSVQYESGPILGVGKITVPTTGNKIIIDTVHNATAQEFSNYTRSKISLAKEPVPAKNSDTDDVLSQLERLSKLREQNLLSEEEFVEQKKRILK